VRNPLADLYDVKIALSLSTATRAKAFYSVSIEPYNASAADLKSLTHSRQKAVQGLQIESGTSAVDLTFASVHRRVFQANVKSKTALES
jgi:hypothetical protein